jgi:pimeloyl-ACP methyl ester carboxylesterase
MLYYKSYILGDTKEWVVFVHGAGGSSSVWFKQIKDFKEHFNVLLLDLRGHGKSQSAPQEFIDRYRNEDYTFKAVSKDILEVLDHLRISKAHFVGVSLGTIIIRTIGEIAPERVSSMILAGAITRLNVRSKVLIALGHFSKQFIPFMWLYGLFAWIIMPRKRHEESRSLFVREAKKLYHGEFMKWFQLTYEATPLLRYFTEKELRLPTLYLMGDEDYMFLPPVKMIVLRHTFSRLDVVENSGHVCNVDQPDAFNERAIAFIQSLPFFKPSLSAAS